MASRWIWWCIKGLNLFHPSGRSFALSLGLWLTALWVSTSNPMVRQHSPGPNSCCRWNMRKTTNLSLFQCTYGYQPPVFPSQERQAACPSVLAFIPWCWQTWMKACSSHLHDADRYTTAASRSSCPGLFYQVGQKVWLYTQDIIFGWSLPSWGWGSSIPSRSRRLAIL